VTQRPLRRILVIDDDRDVLRIVCVVLESMGHFETEPCNTARGAVEAARSFEPDMILLDVMMPEMDGPAVLKALRAEPSTEAIPVVFMTAKVMPNETHHYTSLGVAGVIAKPFQTRSLIDRIHAIWQECTAGAVSASETID
jgi:two-component system OmpR family response regulator